MKVSKGWGSVALAVLALGTVAPAAAESSKASETSPDLLEPVVNAEVKNEGGWTGFPLIAYGPETSLLFGGVVLYQFDLGRNRRGNERRGVDASPSLRPRKSAINAVLVYTLKNQLAFALAPSVYLNGETWRLYGGVEGSLFPDQLYAPGQNSPDTFERYDQRLFALSVGAERQIVGQLRLGGGVRAAYAQVTESEEGGLLDSGQIAGSEGGGLVGFGPSLAWDNRDKDTATSSGGRHELTLAFQPKFLGGEFAFSQAKLQLRQFFQVWRDHVLALELFSEFNSGDVPFQLMATLGGESRMRGYYAGRYRDLNQVVVQAEYRLPLVWRLGGVAYVGAGNVTRRVSDFDVADPKVSAGAGLRVALSPAERVNLRIDFAVTRQGESNLYVGLSEAF